jgi:hypothetical protein
MTESFLHYLWHNGLFTQPLCTTLNEPIEVISPGFHNLHAGPDFSDARLSIGETLWAGNVEIHVNTSDWFKHGHQNDEAYKNVALHVVFRDDVKDTNPGMPVCELADKIDLELYKAYERFIAAKQFVPCADKISRVSEIDLTLWLERMLIEKLEQKADFIQDVLALSQNDWEEALYHLIARSFGFSVNALPFEMLARSVSYKILAHHADNQFQVEALMFGQAGLLTQDLTDIYGQELFREYTFLRKKYKLVPVSSSLWKFLRMRPVNFPTIRLAQFASLLSGNAGLLTNLMSMTSIDSMCEFFRVRASVYWDNHFIFDKETPGKPKQVGRSSAELLIMNSVLPFMFLYGTSTGNESLSSRALGLYEQLPGEDNSVINRWKQAGMDTSTAFMTQALMNLKVSYCDKRDCLHCRIGNLLLKDPAFINF